MFCWKLHNHYHYYVTCMCFEEMSKLFSRAQRVVMKLFWNSILFSWIWIFLNNFVEMNVLWSSLISMCRLSNIFVAIFFRQAHLKKSKQIFDILNLTCPNWWATKDIKRKSIRYLSRIDSNPLGNMQLQLSMSANHKNRCLICCYLVAKLDSKIVVVTWYELTIFCHRIETKKKSIT